MRYMGGKNRIKFQIAQYLKSIREPYQTYFEPFCGGAWVLQEMGGKRIASDGCYPLIAMYKDLQNGWIPPDTLTEEKYQELKKLDDPYCGMKAFAGFGCSHSGKYFNGYARSGKRNYCSNARNSLLKQKPLIEDVQFLYGEYQAHNPVDMLIYCDPPYEGTTAYGYFKSFDHEKFWDKMREWSKCNTVVVSEYIAPRDFECVLEILTKTDMRVSGKKENRIEKLFRIKDV